jgi:glycosyltransferase involved in cell wall biosynthesis
MRIHVLMSTFNGAPYLEDQIESILRQTVTARLFVRDDGSTDHTPYLLQKFSRAGHLQWMQGQNLGVADSFLRLLSTCSANADYVAFSDQDDVWLTDKLERAIRRLKDVREQEPALYCSRAVVTDASLRSIGLTPLWPKQPAFGNALVENIATGCTIVLNRPAINLLLEPPRIGRAIFHDWWCYLVVSALGTVLFDPEPSLLYRQHRDNAVGASPSPIRRAWKRIRRQFEHNTIAIIIAQAEEFSRRYETMLSPDKAQILSTLLKARRSIVAREMLLFDKQIFRQFPQDDALLLLRLTVGPWGQASRTIASEASEAAHPDPLSGNSLTQTTTRSVGNS